MHDDLFASGGGEGGIYFWLAILKPTAHVMPASIRFRAALLDLPQLAACFQPCSQILQLDHTAFMTTMRQTQQHLYLPCWQYRHRMVAGPWTLGEVSVTAPVSSLHADLPLSSHDGNSLVIWAELLLAHDQPMTTLVVDSFRMEHGKQLVHWLEPGCQAVSVVVDIIRGTLHLS